MTRRYNIMAILLVAVITLLVLFEALEPTPINWYPSFNKNDKIPYGTYIFHKELSAAYPNDIQEINIPPYEFLEDSIRQGTYFFLNNYVDFDQAEANRILNWVAQGNTLFIASRNITNSLKDTLNLQTTTSYDLDQAVRRPMVNLVNPQLKNEIPYLLDKDESLFFFKDIDTAQTLILGQSDYLRDKDSTNLAIPKINYLSIPFKKGTIFFHTFPEAFTNFFMLTRENYKYTQDVLAYLPKDGTLYIDQHYKSGKPINTSPLHVIFNNRYLKWAYYLLLISVLLWVVFNGKRKQRSIPIVKPLPNQTLAFTKTIAGMYYEKKSHKQIAKHQINHLKEYIRSTYNLDTQKLDTKFIEALASKSEKPVSQIKKLMNTVILIQQKNTISESELITLNSQIEKFKKQA